MEGPQSQTPAYCMMYHLVCTDTDVSLQVMPVRTTLCKDCHHGSPVPFYTSHSHRHLLSGGEGVCVCVCVGAHTGKHVHTDVALSGEKERACVLDAV